MVTDPKTIVVYEDPGGSWSALYVNGEHVYHGDHHNVIEKLVELLGIEWRQDTAFLLPGNAVCATVQQVEERVAQRERELAEADEKEAHAHDILGMVTAVRHKWSNVR